MDQNKKAAESEVTGEEGQESAPRARNRTVLLTPDITGQVRARLAAHEDNRAQQGAHQQVVQPVVRRPVVEAPQGRPRMASHSPEAPVAPAAAAEDGDALVWGKETRLVGFLVSFDKVPNGEVFILRSGRIVVTSQRPPGGSYLLLQDESISAMHAIMRISESGEILVLDQLSEAGTGVTRIDSDEEATLSGDKASLEHGDVIRFGKRRFSVCILARA